MVYRLMYRLANVYVQDLLYYKDILSVPLDVIKIGLYIFFILLIPSLRKTIEVSDLIYEYVL